MIKMCGMLSTLSSVVTTFITVLVIYIYIGNVSWNRNVVNICQKATSKSKEILLLYHYNHSIGQIVALCMTLACI